MGRAAVAHLPSIVPNLRDGAPDVSDCFSHISLNGVSEKQAHYFFLLSGESMRDAIAEHACVQGDSDQDNSATS